MRNSTSYAGELSFLNHVLDRGTGVYRAATWLRSPFDADRWQIQFDHQATAQLVDFRVRMQDGSSLTDTSHARLLETFKLWLCASTHPHASAGRQLSARSMQTRVRCTLHLIDYLLLRQEEVQLCKLGLAGLTSNDLLTLVSRLASTNDVSESVYGWTPRLRELLRAGGNTISAHDLAAARQDVPTIDDGLDRSDQLGLSCAELLTARAWIWREGLYRQMSRAGYKIRPDMVALTSRIYADTLWGVQKRTIPFELMLHEAGLAERERLAVPVREVNDDCAGDRMVALYMRCLGNLKLLQRSGIVVPAQAFDAISQRNLQAWLQTKEIGRFQTLPQDVVLGGMRSSIAFALTHGEHIVDAYVAVAEKARELSISIPAVCGEIGMDSLISEHLIALGVKNWRLQPGARAVGDYYERLRRNEGLCELVMILVGAVFLIVGAVTARRNGELTDLRVGSCLDKSGRNLLFFNRKSGFVDTRQREARPLPATAARLIRLIERLHQTCLASVDGDPAGALFAYPSRTTGRLTDGTANGVYFCVDLLCDYFEFAGDSPETRYYVRQHQLRRFFAIAFFWGSGFGGLDTLRWFLGHTDPKHVWRYILESVPGKILTSVRSRYAVQALLGGNTAAEALADLVEEKFNTREFSVLSVEELEEYVEVLLEDTRVIVEPQFIETDSGTAYTIAILVTQTETIVG